MKTVSMRQSDPSERSTQEARRRAQGVYRTRHLESFKERPMSDGANCLQI